MNIRKMAKSGAAALGCAALILAINPSNVQSDATKKAVKTSVDTEKAVVVTDSQVKESKKFVVKEEAYLKSIPFAKNAEKALKIATHQWSKKLQKSARIKTYNLADFKAGETDIIAGVGASPILP